ncbi:MAG: hypothetical protein ACRETA_00480 [Gammaproteobacteria bacterium]
MKTTVRIAALALTLGLAGVLTTAWGAESVVNLISQGESVTTAVNSAKSARDAAVEKNNALAAEGKQIVAEQQKLQADIGALKTKEDSIKQETDAYKSNCQSTSKRLSPDQYNACKAQHDQIQSDIDQAKTQPPILQKRQADFIARATKYNQEIKDQPKQVSAADTKYRNSIPALENWVDAARTMVASAAFQPYAKKAGCPNVMKPPKSLEAMMTMSNEILTCLKKVAGTN